MLLNDTIGDRRLRRCDDVAHVIDAAAFKVLQAGPGAAIRNVRDLPAEKYPAPIVKTLHDAALAAVHTPAVRDRLARLGAEITPDDQATPQYLGNFVKSEIAKWAAPIKASGVSVE